MLEANATPPLPGRADRRQVRTSSLTRAGTSGGVLAAAPPDVAAWVRTNQPGRYSMGLVAESLREMPTGYDPTLARVPGLIIRGEFDRNAPASDTQVLAAAYGSNAGAGPATIVTIPGALMLPRIEAAPRNTQYWDALIRFIDP